MTEHTHEDIDSFFSTITSNYKMRSGIVCADLESFCAAAVVKIITLGSLRAGVSMRTRGGPPRGTCVHMQSMLQRAGPARRAEFHRCPFGSGPKGKSQKQEFEHGYV